METLPLGFAVLLNYLSVAVQQIADPRLSSNATRYKLGDVSLGASPMAYLTRWRMLLAGDKLANSSDPVYAIAPISQLPEPAIDISVSCQLGVLPFLQSIVEIWQRGLAVELPQP